MRRYRRIGWFSLIVLAMGLLSMGLDTLRDHLHSDLLPCKYCHAIGAHRGVHLAPNEPIKEDQPCNACFLHKVLANSLIPIQSGLAVLTPTINFAIFRHFCSSHQFFRHQVIRGPPLS